MENKFMSFRDYLNESDDKVYVAGNELWVAYAPGSGTATQFNKSYITSKREDSNFDLNAEKIGKWSKKAKALKTVDNKMLFELPVFVTSKSPYNDKPKSVQYMVVADEKSYVINFFKSKKEAQAWLK